MIKIRYSKNGDLESYDTETGETVGHITTMGNYIEETPEEKEAREKRAIEAMKENGLLPY